MPRRAREEEFDDEFGETLSGDTLCEQWREFIDDKVDNFNLVPRDFGSLSESYLDAFVRSGPRSIESEARAAFAEALYQKYSELLEDFMAGVGRRGIDPRAEAESCGGNFFWDSFVIVADKRALRNVWDLFNYGVVVVRQPTFPLHYERYRAKNGRIAYRIIKDSNFIRFSSYLSGIGFEQKQFDRVTGGEYESEGVGFAGAYLRANDIVKKISEGASYITSEKPIVGVFDWETGAGAVVKVNGKIDIPFSDMIIEVDGVVRDAYERKKMRV